MWSTTKVLEKWIDKLPLWLTDFENGYYILGPINPYKNYNFEVYIKVSQMYVSCLLKLNSLHEFKITQNKLNHYINENGFVKKELHIPIHHFDSLDLGVYFSRVDSFVNDITNIIIEDQVITLNDYSA